MQIGEEIQALREEEYRVAAELEVHRDLDDDASRDAAVGGPAERRDAFETRKAVDRFTGVLENVRAQMTKLETERDELLDRL